MSDKCLCCKEYEIRHIKRGICGSCYAYLRTHNELDLFPVVSERLLNKPYKVKYPSMIDDFEALKTDNSLTLEKIGQKHHLTRERVRQIYERYNGFHYTVVTKRRSFERKHNKLREIEERRNPNYKVNNYKDGLGLKGAFAEKKVLDICNNLHYKVTPFVSRTLDLVINGYGVDVKSAYKSYPNSKTSSHKHYHFHVLESQKIADFLICYAVPVNKFFIIPSREFPKSDGIFIPEKPTIRGRYWKYLEAWHLLEKPQDVTEITFNTLPSTDSREAVNL